MLSNSSVYFVYLLDIVLTVEWDKLITLKASLAAHWFQITQKYYSPIMNLAWFESIKRAWFQLSNKQECFARSLLSSSCSVCKAEEGPFEELLPSQMVHLGTCSIFTAIKLRETDDGKQKKGLPDNKAAVQSCDSWVPILPMLQDLVFYPVWNLQFFP